MTVHLGRHDCRGGIRINRRGCTQVHRVVIEVDIVVAPAVWPGAKLKNLLLVGPQIDYDQISVAIFILHRPQLIGPWIVPQSVVVTDDRKGTYGISPEIILDDITLCP